MTGIKFQFPSVTNHLVITWARNDAPLAEVGRQAYPPGSSPGQAAAQNVLVPLGLDGTVYTFRFYESLDGTTLNSLLDEWSVDCALDSISTFETYAYIVDRGEVHAEWSDPVSNTIELRDSRLKNKNYTVSFRGTGFRVPVYEYVDRSDDGGGFDLIAPESFSAGDTIFVQVAQSAVSQNSLPPSSTDYGDVVSLSASGSWNVAYNKKLIVTNLSAGVHTLTFPAIATMSDTKFRVSTHSGSQRYLILQFTTNVVFQNRSTNRIILGRGETIEILIKGGSLYIIDFQGQRVGQRIFGDLQFENTLYRDGSEYNVADYPRLYDWMLTLPAGHLLSYTAWNDNKGMFALSADGTKFKVPDSRNMFERALKTLDFSTDTERSVNYPGGFQSDALKKHAHKVFGQDNQAPPTGNSSNEVANLENAGAPQAYFYRLSEEVGGIETRPVNEGLLPLITI